MNLNDIQSEIARFVKSGHNVFITGQAGTGKSELIKFLIRSLKASGVNVGVICSSGIATQVFEKGLAYTVHSYYGLQTAELSATKLIDHSISANNEVIAKRLQDVDCIIWDEASMSSQRILEIVNAIHHKLSSEENIHNPFAAKQLVLVGEFLQLRPVPSTFDDGNFMFQSPLFGAAITHRFELLELMRQLGADQVFVTSLRELRLGKCSEETQTYLQSLSRQLPRDKEENAVHIFFKKTPVLLLNRLKLEQLMGEKHAFNAIYSNNANMNWPCQKVLQLKVNCKVLLIWNKSEELRNGCIGMYNGQQGEKLIVHFKDVGRTLVGRETWVRHNQQGDVVSSIIQYPLVLAYALTCHKSQGMTLESAIIHCSREFVPGLHYVAMSRVKHPNDLQLLAFNKDNLLKPSQEVIDLSSNMHTTTPVEDLSCCRKKELDMTFFKVSERFTDGDDNDHEMFMFPNGMFDGPTQACFDEEEIVPLEITDLLLRIKAHKSVLSSPPISQQQSVSDVIASLKVHETSNFAFEENRAFDQVLNEDERCRSKLNAFWELISFHVFLIFEKHISESTTGTNNAEIVYILDISKQGFTEVTASLNQFWCSQDFANYGAGLFESSHIIPAQKTVAVKIAMEVYRQFLKHVGDVIKQDQRSENVNFNVEDMSSVGKAKVRFVGGWAIRKVLQNTRSFIHRNITSVNSQTIAKVKEEHYKCELLEANIIVPYAKLEETAKLKNTLEVVEERQYRERGLIHISDAVFHDFMALEGLRVSLLNKEMLLKEKDGIIENACAVLSADDKLKTAWMSCFSQIETGNHKVILTVI